MNQSADGSEPMTAWDHVTTDLLAVIRARYPLDWEGIHGIRHWERVRDNGRRLAATTGADLVVVEYFAALHDSRRRNDGLDPGHGARAAELVRALDPSLLPLEPERLDTLAEACRTHTHGDHTDDITIATCWDADRLDLLRVGIRPDPEYLVTDAAKDPQVLEWAMARSGRR